MTTRDSNSTNEADGDDENWEEWKIVLSHAIISRRLWTNDAAITETKNKIEIVEPKRILIKYH